MLSTVSDVLSSYVIFLFTYFQLLPYTALTDAGLQKTKGEPFYRVELNQHYKMVYYCLDQVLVVVFLPGPVSSGFPHPVIITFITNVTWVFTTVLVYVVTVPTSLNYHWARPPRAMRVPSALQCI